MAQQIKKKYIAADAIDGSKIKLGAGQGVRAIDSTAATVDLIKLGPSDEVLLNGQEAATKASVEAAQSDATSARSEAAAAQSTADQAITAAAAAQSTADQAVSDAAAVAAAGNDYLKLDGSRNMQGDLVFESSPGSETVLDQNTVPGDDAYRVIDQGAGQDLWYGNKVVLGSNTTLTSLAIPLTRHSTLTSDVTLHFRTLTGGVLGASDLATVVIPNADIPVDDTPTYTEIRAAGEIVFPINLALTAGDYVYFLQADYNGGNNISAIYGYPSGVDTVGSYFSVDNTWANDWGGGEMEFRALNVSASIAHNIKGLANPVSAQDAATKAYVDTKFAADAGGDFKADGTVAMTGNLNLDGHNLTGAVDVRADVIRTNAGAAVMDIANRNLIAAGDIKLDWSGADPSLASHKLTNVADPTADQDAATKIYVDNKFAADAGGDFKADGTVAMTGSIDVGGNDINNVGNVVGSSNLMLQSGNDIYLQPTNTTFVQSPLDIMGNAITSVADPSNAQDAATKNYVDNAVSAVDVSSQLADYLKRDGSSTLTGDLLPDSPYARKLGDWSASMGDVIAKAFYTQTDATLNQQTFMAMYHDTKNEGLALTFLRDAQTLGRSNGNRLANAVIETIAESGSTGGMVISTGEGATNGGKLFIETGKSTANSGNIEIMTGLVDSGTRGKIILNASAVQVTSAPAADADVATKKYVDDSISAIPGVDLSPYLKADGTVEVTGSLKPASGAANLGANNKVWGTAYIQSINDGNNVQAANYTSRKLYANNGSFSDQEMLAWGTPGQIDVKTNKITNLATPTANTDAATKAYVDAAISGAVAGDFKADGSVPMTGTLNMGGQEISDALSIHNAAYDAAIDFSTTRIDMYSVGAGHDISVAAGDGGGNSASVYLSPTEMQLDAIGGGVININKQANSSASTVVIGGASVAVEGTAIANKLRVSPEGNSAANIEGNVLSDFHVLANPNANDPKFGHGSMLAEDGDGSTAGQGFLLTLGGKYGWTGKTPFAGIKGAKANGLDSNVAGRLEFHTRKVDGSLVKAAQILDDQNLDMVSNKITNLADPTAAQDAATKAYVDAAVPTWNKYKHTLDATDITNQYIDLPHLVVANSVTGFVDRLAIHEGAAEDYTLSTVGGVTRLTFLNDIATGGPSALVAGDSIYVKYQR